MAHLVKKDSSIGHKASWVIWVFKDGKPGHEAQIDGLVNALTKWVSLEVHTFSVERALTDNIINNLSRYKWSEFPNPDLIIGAGHSTHLWMLFARFKVGSKIVVLMKPSLPLFLFDLALIPKHDEPHDSKRVIATRGVLNKIQQSASSLSDRGLILIGGVSKHYYWDSKAVFEQVNQLVLNNPNIKWELTTSRRTPEDSLKIFNTITSDNLIVTPFEETDLNWVAQRLSIASRVWVTEDSISMVYEALSAGAEVGLISLEALNQSDRIVRGIQSLRDEGLTISNMQLSPTAQKLQEPFDEAKRCAQIIVNRFLS